MCSRKLDFAEFAYGIVNNLATFWVVLFVRRDSGARLGYAR
jgi:hypothetical protein